MSAPPRYARISDQPALERALVDGDVFEAQTVAGQSVQVTVEQLRALNQDVPWPSTPAFGAMLIAAEDGTTEQAELWTLLIDQLTASFRSATLALAAHRQSNL